VLVWDSDTGNGVVVDPGGDGGKLVVGAPASLDRVHNGVEIAKPEHAPVDAGQAALRAIFVEPGRANRQTYGREGPECLRDPKVELAAHLRGYVDLGREIGQSGRRFRQERADGGPSLAEFGRESDPLLLGQSPVELVGWDGERGRDIEGICERRKRAELGADLSRIDSRTQGREPGSGHLLLEVLMYVAYPWAGRALVLAVVELYLTLRLPPHQLADNHPRVDPDPVYRVQLERPLALEADVAEARRLAAEARLNAEQLAMATELAQMLFMVREADRMAAYIDGTALPNLARALASAQAAYQSGMGGFGPIAELRLMQLAMQLERADARREREAALADLSLLVAGDVPTAGLLTAP